MALQIKGNLPEDVKKLVENLNQADTLVPEYLDGKKDFFTTTFSDYKNAGGLAPLMTQYGQKLQPYVKSGALSGSLGNLNQAFGFSASGLPYDNPKNEGQRLTNVRAQLDTAADDKIYSFSGISGLEGYNNAFLKKGKSFIPVSQDQVHKYGTPTQLDFDSRSILQLGYGVAPMTDFGINANRTLEQSQSNYNAALNDSSTPRVTFGQNADGTVKQDGGTVVSGAEGLAQQNATRAAYNAETERNGLPLEQQPFYQANTPNFRNPKATETVASANVVATDIPFTKAMTEKQKSGVVNLVNSGRAFSETDAKNFAFATGQANWSQLVGKTGAQILAASAQKPPAGPPAGGTAYLVKGGDTLSAIAQKFGLTLAEIVAANPDIKNPNLIYPNQKIVIPEVKAKQTADKVINDVQKNMKETLDKTNKTETSSLFKSIAKDEEEEVGTNVEFKIPSLLEKYKALVNTPDITAEKTKIAELDAKLKDLDVQEMKLEADIRKEVEGEAPSSLIRALVAEKAKAIYPQKVALTNEKAALQTKLENDLANAKAEFEFSVKDQENGLKYIENLAETGAKFTSEQYAIADKALGFGTGFTKTMIEAKRKAKNLSTEKDQLDLMSKIVDLQTKLPEGKSFTVNGVTYESMSNPDKDIQIFKETDAKTNTEVIIEYNKKTREVKITNTGVKSKSAPGPATPANSYFTVPKADGSIGYYFGNPKNPKLAQELTSENYLKGKSSAEGVLTEPKKFLDDNYLKENILNQTAYDASTRWYANDDSYEDWLKNNTATLNAHIKFNRDAGYSDKEILEKLLKEMQG